MRPPQLADVKRHFGPFFNAMSQSGINQIVFLSVQGAENQKHIPHHKMEQLIVAKNFEYVFLRPGYFMQNLITTLIHEIKAQNKIFMPSRYLKYNWVDAMDIGRVGACMLNNFEKFKNHAYEITGSEFLGFSDVVAILSEHLNKKITYESPGLIRFYFSKRKQGISNSMIFVMIMLHYFPRFGKNQKRLTDTIQQITGRRPTRLEEFIVREKHKFLQDPFFD